MTKVLVIDDDSIHQRIAQIMIEKHRIYDEFHSFNTAADALKFLEVNQQNPEMLPDVILLDLNMPVISGWDFLRIFERFKTNLAKTIHIYIVTSSVDEKDKLQSKTYPSVKGFISKPLSPDIIRTTCLV